MTAGGTQEGRGRCTVILLAGPSGSGKTRLAALAGGPRLHLDDFYRAGESPALPRTSRGLVDWDHPDSWDAATAMAAVLSLCRTGSADVPVYDIAQNRPTGRHRIELDDSGVIVAEGVFAPELVGPCRAAGVPVEALYLDRSRAATLARRLVRDVAEHRKSLPVLLRRGWVRWREEPAQRQRALTMGCRPVAMAEAQRVVTAARQAGLARRALP